MTNLQEIFLPVKEKDLEGHYEISNLGRVKSLHRVILKSNGINNTIKESIRKTRLLYHGYEALIIKNNKRQLHFTIHRLVALAFIPNPDNKPEVNHKDGNKTNNHVNNLEWSTRSENAQHAYDKGLNVKIGKKGKDNHNYKHGKYVDEKKMRVVKRFAKLGITVLFDDVLLKDPSKIIPITGKFDI